MPLRVAGFTFGVEKLMENDQLVLPYVTKLEKVWAGS
ncbi:hypothetical protein MPLB_160041 [Mesorhizobium sp. ORS 3324]|nr:hypothetical protein MPLB_160041 [Mesorhizobium sp. ORS 3324]